MLKNRILLSLGSNLGDKYYNLKLALNELVQIEKIKVSSVYETSPVDEYNQEVFFNFCISGKTHLSLNNFFKWMQQSEKNVEEKLKKEGIDIVEKKLKGPRYIDIDIIFFGEEVVSTPILTIPHPSYHQRLFVLYPLLEIEPNIMDPKENIPVIDFLKKFSFEKQKIKRLTDQLS